MFANRHLSFSRCSSAIFALAVVTLWAAVAEAQIVRVPYLGSRVIRLKGAPTQISVSDAKVADVKPLGGRNILVTGKNLGQTHIMVWTGGGRAHRYKILIEIPPKALMEKYKVVFPKDLINVDSVGNTLILSGQVSDPLNSERARKIADAYIRGMGLDSKVLNFLTVRGLQQVQLRVKVAEVSRTSLRQLGINFWHRGADLAAGALAPGTGLNTTTAPDLGSTGAALQAGGTMLGSSSTGPPVPLLTTPFISDSYGLFLSTGADMAFPMSIALNLLQSNGFVKVISEPTLVAFSGQQAKFLSGGEFPVPIPQALGQVGIEFKKHGVQLQFRPTVMASKSIHLKVAVTVSEKDSSGAVLIMGSSVPALSTRHAETTIRLKNGQSFAIGGLLQDKQESASGKIPLLGDIPVLGMLFRRSWTRRVETELVILVTANLVQPLKPGEVPALPGEDEHSDPTSVSFFLMGTLDAGKPRRLNRGPAGPVGMAK